MKVKNLYIGKIETVLAVKKTPTNFYDYINGKHGMKIVRIINRSFDTYFCEYDLLYKSGDKMVSLSNLRRFPYPDVFYKYRTRELEARQIVGSYHEASEILPLELQENVNVFKAKKLFKKMNQNDIDKYFEE